MIQALERSLARYLSLIDVEVAYVGEVQHAELGRSGARSEHDRVRVVSAESIGALDEPMETGEREPAVGVATSFIASATPLVDGGEGLLVRESECAAHEVALQAWSRE